MRKKFLSFKKNYYYCIVKKIIEKTLENIKKYFKIAKNGQRNAKIRQYFDNENKTAE